MDRQSARSGIENFLHRTDGNLLSFWTNFLNSMALFSSWLRSSVKYYHMFVNKPEGLPCWSPIFLLCFTLHRHQGKGQLTLRFHVAPKIFGSKIYGVNSISPRQTWGRCDTTRLLAQLTWGRTITDYGGGVRAKSKKKFFTSYVPVKKNSTMNILGKKNFNHEHPQKKNLNGKSLPEPPPPTIINGPSLSFRGVSCPFPWCLCAKLHHKNHQVLFQIQMYLILP